MGIADDPLDLAHDHLVVLQLWQRCLGCHDFHGNHIRQTPKTADLIISPEKIEAYFDGGSSPYGNERHFQAKKEADNDR